MGATLSKDQILKESSWRSLFCYPKDSCELRRMYGAYAKIYHPDSSDGCREVFENIVRLYNIAKDYFDGLNGKSVLRGIKAKSLDGKYRSLSYAFEHSESEYTAYIGRSRIWVVFKEDYKKYYDNYTNMVKSLKYADEAFKKEFERLVPNVEESFTTSNGQFVIIIKKTSEVVSLQDVMEADDDKGRTFKWENRNKHCAWVMSRLYNLACFLDYNDLVFNGFNIKDIYISPTFHTAMLLNGWQYTVEAGDKMIGTTKDIYDVMSIRCKDRKQAEPMTDLESIKMVGRKMFTRDCPKDIADFLNSASTGDCFKDWEIYNIALGKAYGKRTFIEWNFDIDDILLV